MRFLTLDLNGPLCLCKSIKTHLLTVDDHGLAHEVLVDEGGDLAPVLAAHLGGGVDELQRPVPLVLVGSPDRVLGVDTAAEAGVVHHLGGALGDPHVDRLGLVVEVPEIFVEVKQSIISI